MESLTECLEKAFNEWCQEMEELLAPIRNYLDNFCKENNVSNNFKNNLCALTCTSIVLKMLDSSKSYNN